MLIQRAQSFHTQSNLFFHCSGSNRFSTWRRRLDRQFDHCLNSWVTEATRVSYPSLFSYPRTLFTRGVGCRFGRHYCAAAFAVRYWLLLVWTLFATSPKCSVGLGVRELCIRQYQRFGLIHRFWLLKQVPLVLVILFCYLTFEHLYICAANFMTKSSHLSF